MKKALLTLVSFLSLLTSVYATHIRAGEIVAIRDSLNPFRYRFTLTTYTDNVNGVNANLAQTSVIFFFGDGTQGEAKRRNDPAGTDIGNETNVNYYDIDHVFPGNGTFVVGVGIQNRNAGTLNINGGANTQDINIYLQTTVLVFPIAGFNRTPILRNPPIDKACVGQRFIHNPAAFDADGDSIAYELIIPRGRLEGASTIQFVPGYLDPTNVASGQNEAGTGAASFSISATRGDLVWDAPARAGQYNVAFKVKEYRGGALISEIIRDMQILVEDCQNQRPQLVLPNDTCVEAGYRFTNVEIRASDPDGDRITLTSDTTSSGVYGPDFPLPLASFTPSAPQPQASPAKGLFSWQTSCAHIRQQPYSVLFKAEDAPPPPNTQLADLKTWLITVVGPQPKNLVAQPNPSAKSVTLTWDAYSCSREGAQMLIWRKIGCGSEPGPCQTSLSTSGYQVVGQVPIGTTTFTDTNGGAGLDRGVRYSYRLSVQYAPPLGGVSLASQEVCLDLPLLVPVITHVTVDSTNTRPAQQGQITVRWTRPLALDAAQYPGPYSYRLSRTSGLNGTAYQPILTRVADLSGSKADTVYTDRGLNTLDSAYRYRLELLYAGSTLLDTATSASSVRLSVTPLANALSLRWQAAVPWSNQNQTHQVYRESRQRPGEFNLIAQVPVSNEASFAYTDDGQDRFPGDGNQSLTLSADSVYCYRILTVGTYGNDRIQPDLLENYSQILCATPQSIGPIPTVTRTEASEPGAIMAVFPNPSTDIVHVSISAPLMDTQFSVYDVFGKEVYRYQGVSTPVLEVPLGRFPAGMYFYRLRVGKRTLAQGKLVRN